MRTPAARLRSSAESGDALSASLPIAFASAAWAMNCSRGSGLPLTAIGLAPRGEDEDGAGEELEHGRLSYAKSGPRPTARRGGVHGTPCAPPAVRRGVPGGG